MRYEIKGTTLAALISSFVIAMPAFATTIWDESTDGDLPWLGVTPTRFSFGYGLNTIKGTDYLLHHYDDTGSDVDPFYFSLPQGGRLQEITVRISVLEGPHSVLNLGYTLAEQNNDVDPQWLRLGFWVDYYLDPTIVENPYRVTDLDLRGSNLFKWYDSGMTGNYGVVWSYEYDFLVTAVPEPSTLALFGLGLLGLGLSKWRKLN